MPNIFSLHHFSMDMNIVLYFSMYWSTYPSWSHMWYCQVNISQDILEQGRVLLDFKNFIFLTPTPPPKNHLMIIAYALTLRGHSNPIGPIPAVP